MKQFLGNLWWEEGDGTINIGFRKKFIDDILGECFHITVANTGLVVEGKPMLTIETMDGLQTIPAPLTGTLVFFSTDARDFPDKLNEDAVVAKLRPKEVKVVKKVVKTAPATNEWVPLPLNWPEDPFELNN